MTGTDEDDAFDVLLHDAARADDDSARGLPSRGRQLTVRASRSSRAWIPWAQTAAALLAIGVVLVIRWLHQPPASPVVVATATPQDPQALHPKSQAELADFVAKAVAIRFSVSTPVALARDRRTIQTANDEAAGVRIEDREQVERWRTRLLAAFAETKSYDTLGDAMTLELSSADGRKVSMSLILEPQPRLDMPTATGGEPLGPFILTDELLADCKQVRQRIRRQRLELDGIVADERELVSLPDVQERLCLPVDDSALLATRLRRFANLTALRLQPSDAGGPELPDGGTLQALQELPLRQSLRALCIRGGALTDEALATLATWPRLRTLALHETTLPARGLRAIGQLERLELRACRAVGEVALPAGLTALAIDDGGRDLPFDVAAAVRSLPALRELTLIGTRVGDDVLQALPQTGVTSLRLIDTTCTGDGIAGLAELPRLRTLILSGGSDIDAAEPFGALKQVTAMELWNIALPADGLEALRAALPACQCTGRPEMVPLAGHLLQRLRGCEF